jgi:hypothetical protein
MENDSAHLHARNAASTQSRSIVRGKEGSKKDLSPLLEVWKLGALAF